MICLNCGMQLPDDSEFCQYCGSKISALVEQAPSVVETGAPEQNTIPKSFPIVTVSESSNVHENVNNKPSNATFSEKKASNRWRATVICLSALFLVLAGLNVYQYISSQKKAATIAELSETITNLNTSLSKKETHIEKLNKTISDQKTKITSLNDEVSDLKIEQLKARWELNFYEKCAAIVPDDGTKKYHVLTCPDYDHTLSFWIYNYNQAEILGYLPCTKCH